MSAMVGLNIWRRLTLLLFAAASARAVVSIEKKSEFRFPAVENSQGDQLFEYYADRAGQVEYDPLTKQLWVVGEEKINVLQLGTDLSMTRLADKDVNDVDLKQIRRCGKYFLITGDDLKHPENGKLYIYKRYNAKVGFPELVRSIPVGARPKDVIITKNCRNVLVAMEGAPFSETAADGTGDEIETNPPGLIVRLMFKSRDLSGPFKKANIGFEDFNSRVEDLKAEGLIQINEEVPLSVDLEPDSLVFNRKQTKAWATLQENNAMAEIDWQRNQITRIKGLGFKDHNVAGQGLDPSDEDGGININTWPIQGAHQPSNVARITIACKDYLITANEGISISAVVTRVGDVMLDPAVFSAAEAAFLQKPENLGRLEVFSTLGDPDNDGNYTQLISFGTRGDSLWDSETLERIADSGDTFEQTMAQTAPQLFNPSRKSSNPSWTLGDGFDERSNDQGPEPQVLAVHCICNGRYWAVFTGFDQPGHIIVSVIDSANPSAGFKIEQLVHGVGDLTATNTWVDLYDNEMLSLNPMEGLRVIPSMLSPNKKPLLLAVGEDTSSLCVFEIDVNCDG